MRTLLATSSAACLIFVLGASAGDESALKKEQAVLHGAWKVTSLETNAGKEASLEGATLEFIDAKNVTFTYKDKTVKGTCSLNPGMKPKEIDLKSNDGAKVFEGIYRLEKDTLTICVTSDLTDGRPVEFALKSNKNYVLVVLERVK